MTEYRIISPDVLAEFRARGDQPEFWAGLWRETEFREFLSRYEHGRLGQFSYVFKKYLPKEGRIVEAGCGRGQYVVALRSLGYDAVGVDFAEPLIESIRRAKPDLPVQVGDVRSLPFADESLAAYVSLGVVEHFWEGPDTILAEAWRVLRPGGLILASVPYFGPHFRKRAARDFKPFSESANRSFYQFYFSQERFAAHIKRAGFTPITTYFYDALYGAKRAYPRFDRLYDSSLALRYGLKHLLKLGVPQIIQAKCGHMQMVVAQKT